MSKIIIVFLLSSLILSATAKESNMNMRAGLWELTTTSDLLQLAQHIPKDQLKGIAQLAKEYGLEMPALENGSAISKTCITQEMAEQQTLPQLYQEDLGCITTNATRNGNHYQANFSCNSTKLKGQGSAKGKVISDTRFSGTSHFKGMAQGTPIDETATLKGKWLAARCD